MNNFSKSLVRLTLLSSSKSRNAGHQTLTSQRNLWNLTAKLPENLNAGHRYGQAGDKWSTNGCSSLLRSHFRYPKLLAGVRTTGGASATQMHTKGERELVEFLTEEIINERKAQKIKSVPSNLDGFAVKLNGADVELVKQTDKEKIVINFNVNHTVDTEDEPEIDTTSEKSDVDEMRSKPRFEVDLVRGGETVSFTCSFLSQPPQEGEYDDIFGIDEVTIFRGEWNDKVYAVAGDVLDGYLYDLLMNFLDEKGITNEFAQKLSDLATAYEHSCYIGMLEGISKFAIGNYENQFEAQENPY